APSNGVVDPKVDHTRSKPGYCWWESPVVDRARTETGINENRHPIAFIVEAADDCVYSLCDLEDAVRKGILSWYELCDVLCNQLSGESEKDQLDKWLKSIRGEIDVRFDESEIKPG